MNVTKESPSKEGLGRAFSLLLIHTNLSQADIESG